MVKTFSRWFFVKTDHKNYAYGSFNYEKKVVNSYKNKVQGKKGTKHGKLIIILTILMLSKTKF